MTPRARKDGREPLSREKIVDKAIEIMDADGIEGISMRRLGEALGVEAMALYHHFPNKDAILDGIVNRIIEDAGPGIPIDDETADWKTIMMTGPAATGRILEAHPKAGWLFMGRQYSTMDSLRLLEAPLQILHAAGFRGQELVDAAHAIFAYTAGWYILMSGEGGSWSGPEDAAIASAPGAAPLTESFAPQLRDWSVGMESGLMALLEGLEARRD